MQLYNTLTRSKVEFKPIDPSKIGIYSCGPTVYWNQHIGNMYAFLQWDLLVRAFKHLGNDVNWVMNITDVGHMTGDNLGAADTGEDRLEKRAKIEKISVWDIADKYIAQFLESIDLLNIKRPDTLCRATENIDVQIELIKKIEKNGFTYQTKMGVVFDTSKFPEYAKFAGLDLSKQIKRGDVTDDPEKKNPWDFFLWVTGNKDHIMQWDSPWGRGYPGWHIECTAMSTKFLGENFDIHTGGIEHIGIHHTNEIAQGYGAFGKSTANFWLHNGWLLGKKGEKLSKSLGNIVTVSELVEKGYDPISFRYLVLNSHYRKGLNFSFDALDSATTALTNLRNILEELSSNKDRVTLSEDKLKKVDEFKNSFSKALSDDLNVPRALAILWEVLKSNIPSSDKYDLALSFDEVLGLGLNQVSRRAGGSLSRRQISNEIQELLNKRTEMRKEGKYAEADKIRAKIEERGYTVYDTGDGSTVKLKNS